MLKLLKVSGQTAQQVINLDTFFYQVVEAVAAALRSVSVTEADLKAAKKALAIDVGESNLSALDLAVDVGVSGIIRSGNPLSGFDKLDLVAQASLADVQVGPSFESFSCSASEGIDHNQP